MKKLIAFVLLLLVVLNVTLWRTSEEQKEEKAVSLKLSKIELRNVLPGTFPGLLKF